MIRYVTKPIQATTHVNMNMDSANSLKASKFMSLGVEGL
jgi:hypothetical protein